jgi:hypothetical protein
VGFEGFLKKAIPAGASRPDAKGLGLASKTDAEYAGVVQVLLSIKTPRGPPLEKYAAP